MAPLTEQHINDQILKDSFPIFRITCNSVAQNPSLQTIKNLRLKLDGFSSDKFQNEKPLTPLLDYIAFPLLLILEKSHMSWDIQEESLVCLSDLLKKTRCCSLESFRRIFSSCFLMLADRKNPSSVSSCSEELKIAALDAVLWLLCGCPSDLLLKLLDLKQTRLQLGHAIFICLKIAQHETNRQLRIQALEVVCKLGLEGVLDDPSSSMPSATSSLIGNDEGDNQPAESGDLSARVLLSRSQSDGAREAIGGFLPGVCFATTKLALGDEKQGHRLTVTSLRTLAYFVTVTLDEEFLRRRGALPQEIAGEGDCNQALAKLQRYLVTSGVGGATEGKQTAKDESLAGSDSLVSATWLADTSAKVGQLVTAVCGQLAGHTHPVVRRHLALALTRIVRSCHRSVPGLVVPCVEALATLAVDPSSVVRAAACRFVDPTGPSTRLSESSCKFTATEKNKSADSNDDSSRRYIGEDEADNEKGRTEGFTEGSNTNHIERKHLLCNGSVKNESVEGLHQEHVIDSHSGPQCRKDAPYDSLEVSNVGGGNLDGQNGPDLKICRGSMVALPASVQDALQDRLCHAIKKLPTLAMASENRLLAQSRQLRGCLLLLDRTRREQLLALPGICSSLMLAVSASTAYDAGDPDLLLEGTIPLEPCSSSSSFPPLLFPPPLFPLTGGGRRLHLSPPALSECWQLCRVAVAGGSVSAPLLLQAWTDALHGNGHLRAELLDVLAALLSGYSSQNDEDHTSDHQFHSEDELEQLVSSLLDIILTDKMLLAPVDCLDKAAIDDAVENDTNLEEPCGGSVPKPVSVVDTLEHIYTEFNSPFNPCLTSSGFPSASVCRQPSPLHPTSRDDPTGNMAHSSSRRRKQRALVTAASLRVVAACSRLLSASFVPFLSRIMCPLLEKCGDRNLLVSEEARRALDSVGLSCGYRGGLRELVEEAIPHYWFPLSMQLRRPQQYPKAPQILQVALECSSAGGCNRLSDFLQQVLQELLQCLDSHRSLAPQQLLALLRLYIASNTGHGQPNKAKEEPGFSTTINQSHTSHNKACNCTFACINKSVTSRSELDGTDDGPSKQTVVPSSTAIGPLALFLQDYHGNHLRMRSAFETEESDVQRNMEKKLFELGIEDNEGVKGFKKHSKAQRSKDLFSEISDETVTCDENSDKQTGATETVNEDSNDAVTEDDAAQNPPPLEGDGEGEDEENTDEKKEVPADVQLIVNILERCCFLLHTRDRDTALVLLDTIELGCRRLRAWEDSQLPVLHKVWKPLMLRVKDADTVVSLRALTVCCVMVAFSGDFLRKRCLKELLPRINTFLNSQSVASLGKTDRSGYHLTPAYEAQRRLLETLYPQLIAALRLGSGEMIEVVHSCVGYLDNRQPRPLMQASLTMLGQVAISHPRQVWVALGRLLPPTTVLPPQPHGAAAGLAAIRLDGGIRERSHLPPAVLRLFKELS